MSEEDSFTCKSCRLYKKVEEKAEAKPGRKALYEMIGPYCKDCIRLYRESVPDVSGDTMSKMKFYFFAAIGVLIGSSIIFFYILFG